MGESRHRLPRGRTAPVHPVVITHRRSAQGPLPKSRTTEQSHDSSVAHTRQVTVTRITCGVDIASSSLEARLGRQGALTSFANNAEGIAALAAFCHAHQVDLVVAFLTSFGTATMTKFEVTADEVTAPGGADRSGDHPQSRFN